MICGFGRWPGSSSGDCFQAAGRPELASVSRREFLDWCGRWHIRVHRWDDRDLDHDLAFSRPDVAA